MIPRRSLPPGDPVTKHGLSYEAECTQNETSNDLLRAPQTCTSDEPMSIEMSLSGHGPVAETEEVAAVGRLVLVTQLCTLLFVSTEAIFLLPQIQMVCC